MLTCVFAFLVVVHGLIHLMGAVKGFALADPPQLSQPISPPMGIAWLAAALVLIAAAAAFLFGCPWWWMIAISGIVLSQVLIVMFWRDAKFGTGANVILLAAAIVGYGTWNFTSMVTGERHSFLQRVDSGNSVVTREHIDTYPPVVQRWLLRSGVVGRDAARTVYLTQEGTMRSSREGKWMPFEAEQWFTTKRPGFFWTADVTAMPGLHIAARDKYEGGRGSMLIKALSLFPIANTQGKEIDQGTMVRYLAELSWFPSAALSDYLRWEQTGSSTARVTMTYGGISASGIFTFDANGDVLSFEAKRYYDRKSGPTLEEWYIHNDPDGYKTFEGVRVPAKSTVTWKLEDGDLTWLTLDVVNVHYNPVP